jgi:hypoxanthine phosphoribosyltransferase
VRCLFSEEELARRIRALAREISADYAGRPLVLVGVLKGAWVFLADLVRHLSIPVRIDFVKMSSYGAGTQTTGRIELHLDLTMPVTGEDLLVVEDIVDTGTSCRWLLDHLKAKGPASVRYCVLLDNPTRRIEKVKIDYVGFTIPNCFVVGYGIDWAERYRYLPYIGAVTTGEHP